MKTNLTRLIAILAVSASLSLSAKAQVFVMYGNGNVNEGYVEMYSASLGSPTAVAGLGAINGGEGIALSGDNSSLYFDYAGGLGDYSFASGTYSSIASIPASDSAEEVAQNGNIFVAEQTAQQVVEYAATGGSPLATINTGLNSRGVALAGNTLFVANDSSDSLSEYTFNGSSFTLAQTLSFTGNNNDATSVAVSGNELYVSLTGLGKGTVVKGFGLNANGTLASTTGTTVVTETYSGSNPNNANFIAVSNGDLYVSNSSSSGTSNGSIDEYSLSNGSLVDSLTGLSNNDGIAVEAVPEPSTWALLFGGLGVLVWRFRSRRA
jgi:hypothetical protein